MKNRFKMHDANPNLSHEEALQFAIAKIKKELKVKNEREKKI